jgi:NAD(P)-dependent dehydrogenase (short-subunit alcohol dehydrogenase family)
LENLNHKTILITGATSGIGYETALALAKMNATVVGIGRNPEKCTTYEAQIRRDSGNSHVDYLLADLSSLAEVKKQAENFKNKYDRLDVLINNAGGYFTKKMTTVDGYEITFALNHLAHFLLTNELLDLIKASSPARIINVSSAAHMGAKINLDNPNQIDGSFGWQAYGQSKLANVLFTYELSRRLEGSGVTCNCLHPGWVATGFGKNNRGITGWVIGFSAKVSAKKPAEGAETSIYLASSPDVEGISGKYFVDCKETSSSLISYNITTAKNLWTISEKMVMDALRQ